MNTVFKYPVKPDKFSLVLPANAEVLSVQVQHNLPVMWILHEHPSATEPNYVKVQRSFMAFPTGTFMEVGPMKFIGTFQMNEGTLVFHLFELL